MFTKIHGGGVWTEKENCENKKKEKLKQNNFRKIEIPQEAFIGVLKN